VYARRILRQTEKRARERESERARERESERERDGGTHSRAGCAQNGGGAGRAVYEKHFGYACRTAYVSIRQHTSSTARARERDRESERDSQIE